MNMADETNVLKSENLTDLLDGLQSFIHQAAREGTAIHEVERALWQQVLRIGRQCLGQFLALQGNGDQGEALRVDGQEYRRLPALHPRRYVSIFGAFRLERAVYGRREGQKIDVVPLDNRLQLPEGSFSYLLQDWDQSLCVEQAFGQAASTLERILGLKQSVDSLEHMNQEMAADVTTYLLNRPEREPAGEVLVLSADGKGIVMRRQADEPAPKAHRTKGDKASKKRMATVGTVYGVDRYRRTPEEIVAALFRDAPAAATPRPVPQQKVAWASLPREDRPGSGTDAVFAWMVGELLLRQSDRPLVFVSDGQEALWEARRYWLPGRAVDVLDVLHVTPRIWQAAHVFCEEGGPEAEDFVRARLLRILQGKAAGVIRGLREMATKHGLRGAAAKTIRGVCAYLQANVGRMRYDEYLAAGYPIASGAVEGACRHLVKDRMERAGMHWTVDGAQAMLDVRSVYISGLWEDYQRYRIERETNRLYPHRALLAEGLAA
jgi:hypothetical protein